MLSSRSGWELWNTQVLPGWEGGESVCSRFLICSRDTFIKKLQLSEEINPQKAFVPNLFCGKKPRTRMGFFSISANKQVVFGPGSHPSISILVFLLSFWPQQWGQRAMSVPAENFVNYYIFLFFPTFFGMKHCHFSFWSNPRRLIIPAALSWRISSSADTFLGWKGQNHLWCLRCSHAVVVALQAHRNSLKTEKSRSQGFSSASLQVLFVLGMDFTSSSKELIYAEVESLTKIHRVWLK